MHWGGGRGEGGLVVQLSNNVLAYAPHDAVLWVDKACVDRGEGEGYVRVYGVSVRVITRVRHCSEAYTYRVIERTLG